MPKPKHFASIKDSPDLFTIAAYHGFADKDQMFISGFSSTACSLARITKDQSLILLYSRQQGDITFNFYINSDKQLMTEVVTANETQELPVDLPRNFKIDLDKEKISQLQIAFERCFFYIWNGRIIVGAYTAGIEPGMLFNLLIRPVQYERDGMVLYKTIQEKHHAFSVHGSRNLKSDGGVISVVPIPIIISLESDRNRAFSIWDEYIRTGSFSLQVAKELRHLTRKYGIVPIVLKEVFAVLSDIRIDGQIKLVLSQVLKYAIRHGANNISKEEISCLIENNSDVAIKSELIFALGYVLQHAKQDGKVIDQEFITSTRKYIDTIEGEGISLYARNFLHEQLKQHCQTIEECPRQLHRKLRRFSAVRGKKLPTIISKTQQTIAAKSKSTQSEKESKIDMQSIANALKERHKTSPHIEIIPKTLVSHSGSDRPWFTGTYGNVQTLYRHANSGKVVKHEDQCYLVSKFFGGSKYFCGSISAGIHNSINMMNPLNKVAASSFAMMWKKQNPISRSIEKIDDRMVGMLLVDRMIASIFATMSKNQQLDAAAIKKLMECLGDPEEVGKKVLGIIREERIRDAWLPDITSCDPIEKDIAQSIGAFQKKLWQEEKNIHEVLASAEEELCQVSGGFFSYAVKESYTLLLHGRDILNNLRCLSKKLEDALLLNAGSNTPIKQNVVANLRKEERVVSELVENARKELWREVEGMRLHAITAIYNCFVRDKTLLKNPSYFEVINHCLGDQDPKLRGYAAKILCCSTELDPVSRKRCLKTCLADLEQNINVEVAIDFIFQQLGYARCTELFDDGIILRIGELLKNDSFNVEAKTRFCQIINEYLKNYSAIFSPQEIDNLLVNLSCIVNSAIASDELKTEALETILVISGQKKSFPEPVVDIITASFYKFGDRSANIAIMILGAICEDESVTIKSLDDISSKLLDDREIVITDHDITFEPRSQNVAACASISDVVADIFVNSLARGSIKKISGQSLDHLSQALESKGKQTRISSAKALFIASKQFDMANDVLIAIRDYVADKIFDVAVYISAAYTQGLQKLSAKEPVLSVHIDTLIKMAATDDLMLDGQNFAEQINNNILDVLESEAGRQEFGEPTFNLLKYFLLTNTAYYQSKAIKVLDKYAQRGESIPNSIICILEDMIGSTSASDEAIVVLKKLVRNKHVVNEKTLQVLVDTCYRDEKQENRDEAFALLDTADDTQDLPDAVFSILELERLGRAILKDPRAKKDAFADLKKETSAGKKLTLTVFVALSAELDKQESLEILYNAAKNKQIIPSFLLDRLGEQFNPLAADQLTVDIFLCAIQNNQHISKKLELKLITGLDNPQTSTRVLLIFALQAQKGGKLIPPIPERLLAASLAVNDVSLQQEYIHAICVLLQYHYVFDVDLVQQALIKGLVLGNEDIARECTAALVIVVQSSGLIGKVSIDALIKTAASIKCNKNIRTEIIKLLDQLPKPTELTEEQKKQIELVKLSECDLSKSMEDVDKFLLGIDKLSEYVKLLPQNFEQICYIIDSLPACHERAVHILIHCLNKQSIPGQLIESLTILRDSTTSDQIRSSCKVLLEQIAIFSPCVPSANFFPSEESQVDTATTAASGHGTGFFGNVFGASLFGGLGRVFSFWQPPVTQPASPYVTALRSEIAHQAVTADNLNKCISIITSLSSKDLQELTVGLSNLETPSEEVDAAILLFLSCAAKIISLPKEARCILEEGLESEDAYIKSLSFRGLRSAKANNYSSVLFDTWCDKQFQEIEQAIGHELVRDFDLLDTMVSLQYVDLTAFSGQQHHLVERDLLILDLLESASGSERFNLYKKWLEIEETFQIEESSEEELSGKISALGFLKSFHDKQLAKSYQFAQLYDMLMFVAEIGVVPSYKVLLGDTDTYEGLRLAWLTKLIKARCKVSDSYIGQLCDEMSKLPNFSIYEILSSIAIIDNIKEFTLLIRFIANYSIDILKIDESITTASHLRRTLEIEYLCNKIQVVSSRFRVKQTLSNLLARNWPFEELNIAINRLTSKGAITDRALQEDHLIQVLEILDQYKLVYDDCPHLLGEVKSWCDKKCVEVAHKFAVNKAFQQVGKIKSAHELIHELLKDNSDNNTKLENVDKILVWLETIKSQETHANIKSPLIANTIIDRSADDIIQQAELERNPIAAWGKGAIARWARLIKMNPGYWNNNPDFILEALAVAKRANFLITGYQLTDAQILSCIILLTKPEAMGRLLQVATGEGKSTIISICAIVYALKGKKVDIITSSPVLAERDAKEKAGLYKMFGFSCSHNSDSGVYVQGAKPCYEKDKDIVYGEVAQFQFDTLRDQYSQLGTMAGRPIGVAIVDEVDSMLIDDSSKIARLSGTMAGMDQLQPLYYLIWQRLISIPILGRKIVVNNKTYYVYGMEIPNGTDKPTIGYIDTEGNIRGVQDLEKITESEIAAIGHLEEDNPKNLLQVRLDFFKKHLIAYVKTLTNVQVKVPSNLKEFVDMQIPNWVDSAILARFFYHENEQYIVHDGVIKPVDNGTGIVQSSTSWGNGLHQFLQIKEGVKITSETLTTNFLSNMGCFKKYGGNFVGLTGTLGSSKSKQVLADVYHVDFVSIPRSRQKQYLSLPTVIASDDKKWLAEICRSARNEANKGRGVLVICETIEQAQEIAGKLKHDRAIVKLYTRNDIGQEHEVEKIASHEIIVATNLAGRGMDIQTADVEEQGGMHVIVTFLPENQRIEEQAFGRTARQGRRGTGQMIIRDPLGRTQKEVDTKQVREQRDVEEAANLEKFQSADLQIITIKDELFDKFCKLLSDIRSEIRQDIRQKRSWYRAAKDAVISKMISAISMYEKSIVASIEEKWAMFLRKIDSGQINPKNARAEFEAFSKNIRDDYHAGVVMKNPWHHIAVGYDLLRNNSMLGDQYDCDRCLVSSSPNIQFLQKSHRPTYIFTLDKMFYSDGKIIIPVQIDSANLIELKKTLKITDADMDKLPEKLSDEQLNSILLISGHVRQCEAAIQHFDEAIRLDPQHSAAAFVGKGWLLLKCKEAQGKDYKQKAIKLFEQGIEVLSHEMAMLTALQANFPILGIDLTCELGKQITQKMTLLGTYLNSIQGVISTVQASRRLINVRATRHPKSGAKTAKHPNNSDEKEDTHREDILSNTVFVAFGLERNEKKKLDMDFDAYDSFDVAFNDLTVMHDLVTSDQAINTIESICENNTSLLSLSGAASAIKTVCTSAVSAAKTVCTGTVLPKGCQDISVNLQQLSFEHFKTMLDPDIKLKGLSKKLALKQLTDRDSISLSNLLDQDWWTENCRINLEIVFNDKPAQVCLNLSIKDAIKKIEQQPETDVQFNLTLLKANKLARFLHNEILPHTNLCLEFKRLNKKDVENELNRIKAKSLTLEICISKEEVSAIFANLGERETIQFFDPETNFWKTSSKDTIKTFIEAVKGKEVLIKLENISYQTAGQLIKLDCKAEFNITFIDITPEITFETTCDMPVNVSFTKLNKEHAVSLIPKVREENAPFSLEFKHLTTEQAKQVVAKADVDQQAIEVAKKIRTLADMFTNEMKPTVELLELSARGIEHLLEVNEGKFTPWRSMIALSIVASAQMIAGGLLIGTGFGAQAGMGLLTEGAADFVNVGRVWYTGDFSPGAFIKQKIISLAVSLISLKLQGGLDDLCKGIKRLTATEAEKIGQKVAGIGVAVAEETVEQGVTHEVAQLIERGQSVAELAPLVSYEKKLAELGTSSLSKLQVHGMRSLVVKEAGVLVGEAAAKEWLSTITNALADISFEKIRPKISARVQDMVRCEFSQTNVFRKVIRKMCALDRMNGSQINMFRINRIIAEIIGPDNSSLRKTLSSFTCTWIAPIVRGVCEKTYDKASLIFRILSALYDSEELIFMIRRLRDELTERLTKIANETLSTADLLCKHCGIKREEVGGLIKLLREYGILDGQDQIIVDVSTVIAVRLKEINFGQYATKQKAIVDFLSAFSCEANNVETEFDMLTKSISDSMTEQLIGAIDEHLMSPLSNTLVRSVVESISAKIQNKWLVADDQFADDDPNNPANKEDKEDEEEGEGDFKEVRKEEKKKIITLKDQIDGNVKSFNCATQKKEIVSSLMAQDGNAGLQGKDKPLSAEDRSHLLSYIGSVADGEPADLVAIVTLLVQYKLKLKPAVSKKDCHLSEEEKKQGWQILLFKRGEPDKQGIEGVGHFELIGADGKAIDTSDIPSGENDCGYAIIAHLTGKTPAQLRGELVQLMTSKPRNFVRALEAEAWIDRHYSDSNGLLLRGGKGKGKESGASANSAKARGANLTEKDKELIAAYREEIELPDCEGPRKDFLYLDSEGNITCGIGHLISSVENMLNIRFLTKDGKEATVSEKKQEYERIKALKCSKEKMRRTAADHYKNHCTLHMSNDEINKIRDNDIIEHLGYAKQNFPDFDSYPQDARFVILDMDFNLGSKGFKKNFNDLSDPNNLFELIKKRDWLSASTDEKCYRKKIGKERNTRTSEHFRNAAKEEVKPENDKQNAKNSETSSATTITEKESAKTIANKRQSATVPTKKGEEEQSQLIDKAPAQTILLLDVAAADKANGNNLAKQDFNPFDIVKQVKADEDKRTPEEKACDKAVLYATQNPPPEVPSILDWILDYFPRHVAIEFSFFEQRPRPLRPMEKQTKHLHEAFSNLSDQFNSFKCGNGNIEKFEEAYSKCLVCLNGLSEGAACSFDSDRFPFIPILSELGRTCKADIVTGLEQMHKNIRMVAEKRIAERVKQYEGRDLHHLSKTEKKHDLDSLVHQWRYLLKTGTLLQLDEGDSLIKNLPHDNSAADLIQIRTALSSLKQNIMDLNSNTKGCKRHHMSELGGLRKCSAQALEKIEQCLTDADSKDPAKLAAKVEEVRQYTLICKFLADSCRRSHVGELQNMQLYSELSSDSAAKCLQLLALSQQEPQAQSRMGITCAS